MGRRRAVLELNVPGRSGFISMDVLALLRFVSEHNDRVIGVLVALFIATCIALLLRSLNEGVESGSSSSTLGHGARDDLSLGAIEETMRKVLGNQAGAGATAPLGGSPAARGQTSMETPSADGATHGAADSGAFAAAMAERERQISELQAALIHAREKAKSGDSSQTETLQSKVDELQAKLTEYEIIEDDIADLSLYKEENARLRADLAAIKLRSDGGSSAPVENKPQPEDGVSTSAPAPSAFALPADAVDADILAALQISEPLAAAADATSFTETVAPAAFAPQPPADAATVDEGATQAMIDAMLAAAEGGAIPGLDENVAPVESELLATNPDKMINEVEELAVLQAAPDDAASPVSKEGAILEERLDAEKLLAEVSMLNKADDSPLREAAAQQPSVQAVEALNFQDDLLAEFKDEKGGGT